MDSTSGQVKNLVTEQELANDLAILKLELAKEGVIKLLNIRDDRKKYLLAIVNKLKD